MWSLENNLFTPFSFPIPFYDETNNLHNLLAKKAMECESLVKNFCLKNPKVKNEKVKDIINQKLNSINNKVEQIFLKKIN